MRVGIQPRDVNPVGGVPAGLGCGSCLAGAAESFLAYLSLMMWSDSPFLTSTTVLSAFSISAKLA
jgi:hypothetical protein